MERIWAVRFEAEFAVPRASITSLRRETVRPMFVGMRAPGTSLPGVIRAGTYFTPRGKEFHYTTGLRKPAVVIDVDESQPFRRFVLNASFFERGVLDALERGPRVPPKSTRTDGRRDPESPV